MYNKRRNKTMLGKIKSVPKAWIAERSDPKFWSSASYCIPMAHTFRSVGTGSPKFIKLHGHRMLNVIVEPAFMCWFFFPDGTNRKFSVLKKFFK
tara:strand:+ start:988 stop:1269 length:282 start_codon:yes stop_codon:yes gene_type:complete